MKTLSWFRGYRLNLDWGIINLLFVKLLCMQSWLRNHLNNLWENMLLN